MRKRAPVWGRPLSLMGLDFAFSFSHTNSSLEGYVPLPPAKSTAYCLPQEDGEIRHTSPVVANSNSKLVSVPPRVRPVTSSVEPTTPAVLPPHPNLLDTHWTRQEVGIASRSLITSDSALRLHVRSVSYST